jgi:hypothetical protein
LLSFSERKDFASPLSEDELETSKIVVEEVKEDSPEIIQNCVVDFVTEQERIDSVEVKEKQKPVVRSCDKRYSEYLESYFKKSIEKLNEYGFKGPFAEEVAQYAIARQIIEDGMDREHTVSMVGMVPGGLNKRVVQRLGLILNQTNDAGYKLGRVTANDGQGCYAFYGDFSNVLSVVAVVMVWDEYVNGEEKFLRTEDLKEAWNNSKNLSNRLFDSSDNVALQEEYDKLKGLRLKVIERCNAMYGPNGSSVKMIVKNMRDVFDYLVD